MNLQTVLCSALCLLISSEVTLARDAASNDTATVGVVSHILVTSDHVEDLSSMEAWKRSFLREGMSDRDKALAVWNTVVKFRHQDAPPNEFLQGESNVHDPIKTFNVYGYGMCCCAAANIEALARYAGLQARGRIIRAHSVPEVSWDGAWHLLDASLINYHPKPDGALASVDEIIAGVKAWYASNPQYRGNDGKLRQFMANRGWKRGPEILAGCPFYDANGWLPAATHGWYSTMQEYDGSADGIYEYGYSQGYQVNVQLRPGERLTRCWRNQGLHVNMAEGGVGCLNKKTGAGDLRYAPGYGDMAPGRIGNGKHEYTVPLADSSFRKGALLADNLAGMSEDGRGPAVHVRDTVRPAVLVVRMPSSYVYLSGLLAGEAVVGAGGSINVQLSDNNGLDWRDLISVAKSGPISVDLGPRVFRRYDYRVKFTLSGAGTGLDELIFRHDIQNSQRALPALDKGENTVHFRAGPAEGTVTVEGSTDPANGDRQLVTSDFHAELNGVREHLLRVEGGRGSVTFPIKTPGDMVCLRLGCHYRVRDARDAWDLQASFDGGKTFTSMDRFAGPTPGSCRYITFKDVPPGTRSALVRFAGTQRNTTCIFSYRIDADYREPHGGFRPVRVLYEWLEKGRVRQHAHVARSPEETYTIRCGEKPVMRAISLELAGRGEGRP